MTSVWVAYCLSNRTTYLIQNQKYEAGLVAAFEHMRSQGRPCNVLDIGTGTGLLSMMSVRNGADSVTACDVSQLHDLTPFTQYTDSSRQVVTLL